MIKIGNVIRIEGLTIIISPKGKDGHQFISPVERRVRSVKECLGSLNMTKTAFDVCTLTHLLRVVEHQINSVPSGLRTKGQNRHNLNTAYLDTIICPNSFLHPWPSRAVSGFMYLNKNLDNYMQDLRTHQDALTSILETYYVSLTKQPTKGPECTEEKFIPHLNDVVAFRTRSDELGGRYTPFKLGLISEILASTDGSIRHVSLLYRGDIDDPQDVHSHKYGMYITTRRVDNIIIVCCVQDQCLDEVFSELGELTISLLQSQINNGASTVRPPHSRATTFKTNLSPITEGEILTSTIDSSLSKNPPMQKLPAIIEDDTLALTKTIQQTRPMIL